MKRIVSMCILTLIILNAFELAFRAHPPFALAAAHDPFKPASVCQFRWDGVIAIPEGGATPKSTAVFKATVRDPDLDLVRLEVELRQTGEPFTGLPFADAVSDYVFSGSQAAVTVSDLANGAYKWQCRARDSGGAVSSWTEFGAAGNVDFVVNVPLAAQAVAYVSPSTVYTNAGQTFSVDVRADVNYLSAFDFKLFWNTALLDCISAVPHPPWPYLLGANEMLDNYNATHGRYWCGFARMYPGSPFSGSTSLATLTFRVQALGECRLDLTDVALVDPQGNPIDGWNGYVDSPDDGHVIAATSHPPVAAFSFYPAKPKAGEQVVFDASSSYDPDGEIMLYQWDWDGDNVADEYSDSPIATFWWPEAGTYQVNLTVIDNEEETDTLGTGIFVCDSSESKIILAGWGFHPSWYLSHKDEHKKLVKIDDLLRDGGERLSWLPPEFSLLEEPEIVSRLSEEIDSSLTPGLTYFDYAYLAVSEAELVNDAWWQSTPQYYFKALPLLVKLGFSSVWDVLVSKDQIVSLVAKISPLAGLSLGIAFSSMSMASGTRTVKDLINWTKMQGYSWALGYYFHLREYWDHADAWNDGTVQSFVQNSIEDDATEEQKESILSETEEYFRNLWIKYEGDQYYDPAIAHNDKGFPPELRNNIRENILNLVLYALGESNYVVNRNTVSVASPVELRISDSQGRITGSVDGKLKEEIPYSIYDNETETATIFYPTDSYNYTVVGSSSGTYGMRATSIESEQIISFNALGIPILDTSIHQYTVDWNALSLGEDGVNVQVDSDGDGIFEYNFTSDSELSRVEYVGSTNGHDLGLAGATLAKSIVGEGYSLSADITIMNYGVHPETFNITIYANTTLVTSQTITLGNASSMTINFTWNTNGFSMGNYAISAVADSVPGETYTADNTITRCWVMITIPGDVDGNKKIDILDLVKMAGVYKTSAPDPLYDPFSDIDGDGDIDIIDIVIAAGHYGESW
jgi:hypothetical protein